MPMPLPEPPPIGHLLQIPVPADAELIVHGHHSDDLAFELIFRRHNRQLFRLARSSVGRDRDRELKILLQDGNLMSGEALAAWPARNLENNAPERLHAEASNFSLC
jgi:hypothetical protein